MIVLNGTSTTGFATLSRTALPGLPDDCTTLTTTLFIVPLSRSSIVLPLRSRAGTVSPTLSIISFTLSAIALFLIFCARTSVSIIFSMPYFSISLSYICTEPRLIFE